MLNLQRTEARRDLAAFVRERRTSTKPQDIGLPAGGRRRTPGLRREEVAQLAGVSVTWYTWFEQGRDIQVSASFLDRVSKALRLDAADRARLFDLAQNRPPASATTPAPSPIASRPVALVRQEAPAVAVAPVRALVPLRVASDSEADRINESIRKVLVNEPPRPAAPVPAAAPPAETRLRTGFRLGIGLTILTAFMLLPY